MRHHNVLFLATTIFSTCYYNINGSLLPRGGDGRGNSLPTSPPRTFLPKTRGGSTRALDKDLFDSKRRKLQSNSQLAEEDSGDNNCNKDGELDIEDERQEAENTIETESDGDANTLHVIKKGGRREPLDKKKVSKHINKNLLSSNFTYHLRLINSSLFCLLMSIHHNILMAIAPCTSITTHPSLMISHRTDIAKINESIKRTCPKLPFPTITRRNNIPGHLSQRHHI